MPWSRFLSAGGKKTNLTGTKKLENRDFSFIKTQSTSLRGAVFKQESAFQLETNALITVMNTTELNASAKPLSNGISRDKGNEYFQDETHSKNTNRILCACFYEEMIQNMCLINLLLKWQHSSRHPLKKCVWMRKRYTINCFLLSS